MSNNSFSRQDKVHKLVNHIKEKGGNITTVFFLIANMNDQEFDEFYEEAINK